MAELEKKEDWKDKLNEFKTIAADKNVVIQDYDPKVLKSTVIDYNKNMR